MKKFEEVTVGSREIACDGGGGPLGHPKVYLQITEETGNIVCPYCSKNYVLRVGNSIRKVAH